MLDKTKVYNAYYIGNSTPKRRNVRILYEDDIGYFVQSLEQPDSKGNGIRWSIKKHFYRLIEVPGKLDVCKDCPLLKTIRALLGYDV